LASLPTSNLTIVPTAMSSPSRRQPAHVKKDICASVVRARMKPEAAFRVVHFDFTGWLEVDCHRRCCLVCAFGSAVMGSRRCCWRSLFTVALASATAAHISIAHAALAAAVDGMSSKAHNNSIDAASNI
jgi:hypothetical protein